MESLKKVKDFMNYVVSLNRVNRKMLFFMRSDVIN